MILVLNTESLMSAIMLTEFEINYGKKFWSEISWRATGP
jgi:hypothetical protein